MKAKNESGKMPFPCRYLVVSEFGGFVAKITVHRVSLMWGADDALEFVYGDGEGQLNLSQEEADWTLCDEIQFEMK